MNFNVSVGKHLQKTSEYKEGLQEDSGMGFRRCGISQLDLQHLVLLGSLGPVFLTSHFIFYNLYTQTSKGGQKFSREMVCLYRKAFVHIFVAWRRSLTCLFIPAHSLQRKVKLFMERYLQLLPGHRQCPSMCRAWCSGTVTFLEAPGSRFYYNTADSRHGLGPLLQQSCN